jgi:hypothetical protein
MQQECLFLPQHDLLVLQTSSRVKQASLEKNKCSKFGLLCTLPHKPTHKLVSKKVIVGANNLHLLPMESMEILLA